MPGLEVAHEVDAAAQAAAAHVQQGVLRAEALAHQEVQLQAAQLVPQPARQIPVAAGGDLLLAQLAPVDVVLGARPHGAGV